MSRGYGSGRPSPEEPSSTSLKSWALPVTGAVRRFTMDEGLSEAVREVFIRLYEEGLIYRSNYIINWCPRCQTALADLEVEHEEISGKLYYLKYPLRRRPFSSSWRPPGRRRCWGTPRWRSTRRMSGTEGVIGKKVILPVIHREIPVIARSLCRYRIRNGLLEDHPGP